MSAVVEATVAPAGAEPSDGVRYRMKDLSEATGLNRQAIHFYIKEGLLPPGEKTGRNMAYYSEHHLVRLRLIRRLQHERFLPLKAIKALLDGRDDDYSEDQQRWLRELKGHMSRSLAKDVDHPETVPVAPVLDRTSVSEQELAELSEIGFIPVGHDSDGERVIFAEDAWMLEALGELRRLGFTAERGFGTDVLTIYEEAISTLFDREVALLRERLTQIDVAQAAQMAEQVVPLVNRFLSGYHVAKIRRFLAALT